MKKAASLFLFIVFSFCVLAGTRVIENPSYEVKNTGIFHVSKVVLSDTSTRLNVHLAFIPHWWILFEQEKIFLEDSETEASFPVVGIEGAEFGTKLVMPESGDSSVVLIFPALDKTIKKVDLKSFSELSAGESIFGISLDSTTTKEVNSTNELPENVSAWLNDELAKNKKKAPVDFNSPQFFDADTAHLVGYIKGYDVRLGFSTGIIYASNDITREDYPIVVQVYPDGRFEASFPMTVPQYTNLSINKRWIPFYIEPGQTLSMILDWDEFLIADRKRNIRYKIQDIQFQGPLAKINEDLAAYDFAPFDYKAFQKQVSTLAPEEFKEKQLAGLIEAKQHVESYIGNNEISAQAGSILRNGVVLTSATRMLDFVSNRSYEARKDSSNEVLKIPVSSSYYDFLKDIPMDDNSLLVAAEFSTFVNRFEYCDPLSSARPKRIARSVKPEITYYQYFQEEKIELTDEEKDLLKLLSKEDMTPEDIAEVKSKEDLLKRFSEKYKEELSAYARKYMLDSRVQKQDHWSASWHLKDSVLQNELGLKSSLVYEIAKIRSLNFTFKNLPKEEAAAHWEYLKQGITNPYLLKTGTRLFEDAFPDEQKIAYALPEGVATEIFRKIINPFKGKILFVDFWATTCGPCVGGIKSMKETREKYKDNPDFDFIFITDERGSPETSYNKFVEEQELKNCFRLSKDDYNYLRQLFKFNGIPRYVVIDKEGNVLNDDFPMHNFKMELSKILAQK
ncbi:TlpA family protein disulfide reductase [Sunxiuqinia indica]|uniref:TlpA family protein disulfide reductase n=1 Tax=Sunxiuqinia indica TaxID=2692584 RepID=UPI00135B37DC|nr:TlpA disulfide reductase family protein [Sunxiuqinia indica]